MAALFFVTVLGLVGAARGGAPRFADSSAEGAGRVFSNSILPSMQNRLGETPRTISNVRPVDQSVARLPGSQSLMYHTRTFGSRRDRRPPARPTPPKAHRTRLCRGLGTLVWLLRAFGSQRCGARSRARRLKSDLFSTAPRGGVRGGCGTRRCFYGTFRRSTGQA